MTNKAGEQPTITQALKPCPWCGGPAHRIEPMGEWLPKGPPHYGPNKVRYVCAALYEDPIRDCPSRQSFDQEDEAEAIAAWNTRTTSLAAQDGLVEAWNEALEAAAQIVERYNAAFADPQAGAAPHDIRRMKRGAAS